MMRTRTEKLAATAMFCAFAMILSYIESVIPFDVFLPLPGFKLGLANIAVAAVFLICGEMYALFVSLARISLSALLFGSVMSFWYSLCGGLLSFAVLFLWKRFLCKFNGYIGLGVMSAVFHNIGQCLCAAMFFGYFVIVTYLPLLLIAALFTGTFTGVLLSLVMKSGVTKIFGNEKSNTEKYTKN